MSEVTVRPVTTKAEEQAFLRMPWTVYKDDPAWVAPLWKEHVNYFDPAHNAELRHITMQKFVAWRGDEPRGTVIAFINHRYNEVWKENAGWFGQFEFVDDEEVAHALLQTAEEWTKSQGATRLLGPSTYSTNSEIGMLVEGFDHPPMLLTPHARSYYHKYVESRGGYEKEMDLWHYFFNGEGWGGKKADKLPEKLTRVVDKIRNRRNFVVRPISLRHFAKEVEIVKDLYTKAWAENWAAVPIDEAEMVQLEEELRPVIDPAITFFVEVDGKPIAFGAPFVNLYEPLQKVHCKPGEPYWWQLLRLIWHWKILGQVSSVRVALLGILEEYRGQGIDGLLYYDMIKGGLPRGYMNIEFSWILETNDMMNRGAQLLGGEVYKIYRVFTKTL
jgi:GNAT superfamily N-acetyltransferase